MRLSEARLLKKENVDFERGVLRIFESKGHKDRMVYLPEDGIKTLSDYRYRIEKELPGSPWLFPGLKPGKPISGATIERKFRECWILTPYAATADKAPTVHCLRHAFVVTRINDWMENGVELQTMLPYLSSYLGHETPAETFYYYHLVNKAFSIIKRKDNVSLRVIPEVSRYEE